MTVRRVGAGPNGQLTLADAPTPSEEPSTPEDEPEPRYAEASPAAPKPPRSAGPGASRGVAEVVVRALDPRLRSAMDLEDGVRRVVINSRYPLYEVRKGDLWYQLETALREVCQTIPEATVPEFDRKVNELMLVSVGLAGRRRRRRAPSGVRQERLMRGA